MPDLDVPVRRRASEDILMAPSLKVAEKTIPYGAS